jgi:hypothetical protein
MSGKKDRALVQQLVRVQELQRFVETQDFLTIFAGFSICIECRE